MARRTLAIAALFCGLMATACGSGDTTANQSSAASSGGGGGGGSAITIKGFDYAPQSLTVKVGTKVTVTNADQQAHTATAIDGSFDSGPITGGGTGSITFSKAGTFQYHCSIHSFMPARTVVVTG